MAILIVAAAGCQTAAAGPPGSDATRSGPRPDSGPAPGQTAPGQAAPGPSRAGPRIMIVGDSISEGSAGDYTWQYRLYEHLLADGVSPRMVGPYHSLYNNVTNTEGDHSYANPRFEHANDARWG